MTKKRAGMLMILLALLYTVVELLTMEKGDFFNGFIPLGFISVGILWMRARDKDESIFKKK
ncbi:hypothetical protein [Paludifilum halophilum]|uniref:DUF3188 domain-containing protein n=1 Tax=Paludifilum halophilum TaxID=1642702 RepID=A0A235B2Q1_9BACL|nr:hypothetical protein [Paludifilum halophilum]OYD06586.1 hypothetical protein CHM34_15960 [Paludifilum halophilum]